MKFAKQLRIFLRMDFLIGKGATGNRDEFAEKMGLSKATLHRYIDELKDLGAPIEYNKEKSTYRYSKYFSLQNKDFFQSLNF